MLKDWPVHPTPALNLHRLWAEGGVSHGRASGEGENANFLAEPLLASGMTPAASAMLRDISLLRSSFPRWVSESCTGCGACWMVCPDSALPGLVTGISELMETALGLVEKQGLPIQHLPRALRTLEKKLREHLASRTGGESVPEQVAAAAADTLTESPLAGDGRAALEQELEAFMNALGEFPLAVTEAYYSDPEKVTPGNGGLLSVTLDPSKCKGCLACIASCPEEALLPEPQDDRVLVSQIRHWEFQQALPTTHPRFIRTEPDPSSPEGFPGLESLLLDKRAYQSLTGGDDAQPGATERTVLHLFTALVEGLMKPRVAALLTRLEELIAGLDRHIRLHLAVDVEDPQAVRAAMGALKDRDFTLSQLSEQMDPERRPLDTDWLERVTGLLSGLKELKTLYTRQSTMEGRASLGMVQTTTEAEAWGSTYPYNPFPFPWTGWSGGGAGIATSVTGMAAGIFDGHMARMAGAFKIIRGSELELEGKYNPEVHDSYFTYFGWRDFTEEEFALCPPVVIAGGDRTLPGGVWQGVSALLRAGRPLKVLNLDSQAYRSLLAPGSGERTEGGTLGMNTEGASSGAPMTGGPLITAPPMTGQGNGAVYIAQCSLGNLPHLMESLKDGLMADRPALFNVYRSRLAENGSAAHQAVEQARLALESRAHPLFRFDPDAAGAFHECLSLDGNPEPGIHWPDTTLQYLDGEGNPQSLTVPLTFAHYALAVPGLEHHFSPAPDDDPGASGPSLTPLEEFLELDAEEREETRPCIQTADARGRLLRLVVSPGMAQTCEERQRHWEALRSLTRHDIVPVDEEAISEQARMEMVERVAHSLFELAQGGDGLSSQLVRLSRVEDTRMEDTRVETEGSESNA